MPKVTSTLVLNFHSSSESKTQLVNQRKQNSYRRVYIYIYILTQSIWTGTKVIGRKHIIQPTGFGACSSTCFQWDGEDMPAPWERSNSPPPPPVRVQKSCVNQFIYSCSVTYAAEEFLLSITPNSITVSSLQ